MNGRRIVGRGTHHNSCETSQRGQKQEEGELGERSRTEPYITFVSCCLFLTLLKEVVKVCYDQNGNGKWVLIELEKKARGTQ